MITSPCYMFKSSDWQCNYGKYTIYNLGFDSRSARAAACLLARMQYALGYIIARLELFWLSSAGRL